MPYPKEDVITSMEKYLIQAHDEYDEMWIEGISILSKRMKRGSSDFNK